MVLSSRIYCSVTKLAFLHMGTGFLCMVVVVSPLFQFTVFGLCGLIFFTLVLLAFNFFEWFCQVVFTVYGFCRDVSTVYGFPTCTQGFGNWGGWVSRQ